jgi:hypothetical protein
MNYRGLEYTLEFPWQNNLLRLPQRMQAEAM